MALFNGARTRSLLILSPSKDARVVLQLDLNHRTQAVAAICLSPAPPPSETADEAARPCRLFRHHRPPAPAAPRRVAARRLADHQSRGMGDRAADGAPGAA